MIREAHINQIKTSKNRQEPKVKKPIVLKIFLVCLAVLGIAQILICCWLAERGNQLKTIEKEIALVENENRQLQKEVANYVSLAKVQAQALKQGFIVNPEILDLTSPSSVALNN